MGKRGPGRAHGDDLLLDGQREERHQTAFPKKTWPLATTGAATAFGTTSEEARRMSVISRLQSEISASLSALPGLAERTARNRPLYQPFISLIAVPKLDIDPPHVSGLLRTR
jgi:hypothetical protein